MSFVGQFNKTEPVWRGDLKNGRSLILGFWVQTLDSKRFQSLWCRCWFYFQLENQLKPTRFCSNKHWTYTLNFNDWSARIETKRFPLPGLLGKSQRQRILKILKKKRNFVLNSKGLESERFAGKLHGKASWRDFGEVQNKKNSTKKVFWIQFFSNLR